MDVLELDDSEIVEMFERSTALRRKGRRMLRQVALAGKPASGTQAGNENSHRRTSCLVTQTNKA
ncbi:MAG: hypothetical protein KDA93_07950 [Planctomycetaceae bacterium]|nr:hypothetical protein [Planctomycetaceae bacterium]